MFNFYLVAISINNNSWKCWI